MTRSAYVWHDQVFPHHDRGAGARSAIDPPPRPARRLFVRFESPRAPAARMSGNVDVALALRILPSLVPRLPEVERLIREESRILSDDEVLGVALRRSLEHLQLALSHETFEYLRWKIEVAREDELGGPRS